MKKNIIRYTSYFINFVKNTINNHIENGNLTKIELKIFSYLIDERFHCDLSNTHWNMILMFKRKLICVLLKRKMPTITYLPSMNTISYVSVHMFHVYNSLWLNGLSLSSFDWLLFRKMNFLY